MLLKETGYYVGKLCGLQGQGKKAIF